MNKIPSNKEFGYSFALIFLAVGLLFFYLNKSNIGNIFLILSFLFVITAKFKPNNLKFLNLIWNKFSVLLNKLISPIIIFFMFFLIITPFGLIARLFSKDLVRIRGKFDKEAKTNFVEINSNDITKYEFQF